MPCEKQPFRIWSARGKRAAVRDARRRFQGRAARKAVPLSGPCEKRCRNPREARLLSPHSKIPSAGA